ncbi:hybrid sensor histidine kinase/response regulator [Flavobacterium sp. WLB]|uniref:tetratricopeptide repeat-containing hybrid sensor histidine kinase/response regulator n=1 Tax=unclassified Flavobacterium TaxID=196869 RepID=UPI0006ABB82B|nr:MULTISPECIES: ATP-binding protein [unclassified Flavobacterium]KOP37835.1 histidine kinase [Flavobacterium sp. VMW]OWU90934.1 histidine kinase [Flavobacterium sp. NLM]PUU69999.1 hybrid sensor histidine kinase/response regulator [Flavobacterium sp. WLB]
MKYYLLSVVCFFNSFLYSQIKQNTDSVSYYNKLANKKLNSKEYNEAVFYTKKSIDFCETNNIPENLANQTFKLGKIYYNQRKYDEALKNFHKSVSSFDSLKPTCTKILALQYIGAVNTAKGDYKTADVYYAKAQKLLKQLGIVDSSEILDYQKAIAFKTNKNFYQATNTFRKIIKKPDNPLILETKSDSYYQLGLIETQLKRNDSAMIYFEKALDYTEKTNNLSQKSKITLAISQYYKQNKNFDLAYSYLDEHYQLENYILKLKNAKIDFNEFQKFKKNQTLNNTLKRESEEKIQLKTYRYSKLVSILAIALISILSLLSLALYKNNIIRNQNNLLLREKNKELILAKNKAEKASKARSEFLSTVSHELRTPLNAINGITHLLLEDNPKKTQLKYLESLKFSGNYLTTFINEILEINKIDSTKVEVENISFNLKELLFNIQSSLKELATANKNYFNLEIDDAIPDNLIGDPTKLSQIILNLINNALKFTQNGNVNVIAKLFGQEDENATVYFEIVDTGIGIPEDKLQTVFESFSQGSIEVNRKYGGTGLGLTIVKKLIELLGGEIKLKSEVGKGSTFTFKLNFKINNEPLEAVTEEKPYNDKQLKHKSILLIEDNKINQMITRKMLENKMITCEIIDNGEDAVELLKVKRFDMILMDVHLPGINGTTATQHIRDFDKTTPIIALTAISLDENRDMLLSFGMNDVITKPFVPDEFYSTIAKFFD